MEVTAEQLKEFIDKGIDIKTVDLWQDGNKEMDDHLDTGN